MAKDRSEILQGTLDLMVLKTLQAMGPMHGFGIARRIEQISGHQLSDPETRLALHLGLRVRHALAAREPDNDLISLIPPAPITERRLAR